MFELEIVILVILIVLIGLVCFLLFYILKGKKSDFNNSNIDNKINEIDKKIIESIYQIKESNKDQFYKINDDLNTKFQINTKELQDFKEKSIKSIGDSYANLSLLVEKQLSEMNRKVDEKISIGFKNNQENLEKVNLALGSITEAQKNLDNLNTQVTSLNQVLSNSQSRGRFGEIALESLLSESFGDTHGLYKTQYQLKNGLRPDAVIFVPDSDKLICIDSKFSFVSYAKLFDNRNQKEESSLKSTFKSELKSQIRKIRDDYIRKDETELYAIMFIPSDGIYSYIQSDDELYESIVNYARKENVILTSPATLQPILANIQMLKVNYEIGKNISDVIKQIIKFKELNITFIKRWDELSNSIETLQKKKDNFSTTVRKISSNTAKIIESASKKNLIEESADDLIENKEMDYDS